MENQSNDKILVWKTKTNEIKINNLNDLLDVLIKIKLEDIDNEIGINKENMIEWVENNFPKKLGLIQEFETSLKEFTNQQFREMAIRVLRKIIL